MRLKFVLFFFIFFNISVGQELSLRQKKMLDTLDDIGSIFGSMYAPLEFKEDYLKWDLVGELNRKKEIVLQNPNLSKYEFQKLVKQFVSSTNDYHVGIGFLSTQESSLPIKIRKIGDKYYLAHIDEEEFGTEGQKRDFPFLLGDEVTHFGGLEIDEAIKNLMVESGMKLEDYKITPTDQSIMEDYLTHRRRSYGYDVPKGLVEITFANGKSVDLTWRLKEEIVPQTIPLRDYSLIEEKFEPKAMASTLYDIGMKESFVPELGDIIWSFNDRNEENLSEEVVSNLPEQFFKAYIYKHPESKKLIGYVRISSFDVWNPDLAVKQFDEIITKMSKFAEALVIDQVNNPGGSFYYLMALLSRLIEGPLELPTNKKLINELDTYDAVEFLETYNLDDEDNLSLKITGYDIYEEGLYSLREYYNEILRTARANKRMTEKLPIFGFNKIMPHQLNSYKGPIVVLVNELGFSCGDLFPAILQDNKRATIFGTKTAGAGGLVEFIDLTRLNQFGISQVSFTTSLLYRENGDTIENLGVTPDVPYEISVEDLKNNFESYKKEVNKVVQGLVE